MPSIKHALKQHFIPHEGNNFHPHFLHFKRAVFYSAFFIAIKAFLVIVAVGLPIQAYLAPDVLAGQTNKIMALTNNVRKGKGLPVLREASVLDTTAYQKAADMAENGYFSHTGPNGHTLSYFLKNAGYKYSTAGENLAMGFSDAESVMSAWMKSPTHYANLIDPDFQEFGVGIEEGLYDGTDTVFVAQHFGRPLVSAPVAPSVEIASANQNAGAPKIVAKPASAPSVAPAKKPTAPVAIAKAEPKAEVQSPQSVDFSPILTSSIIASNATTTIQQLNNPAIQQSSSTIPSNASTTVLAAIQPPFIYQRDMSYVRWSDIQGGKTGLDIHLVVLGNISSADVSVEGHVIHLAFDSQQQAYIGSLILPQKSDALFRTVVSPTVTIKTADGSAYTDAIDWENPKIVSASPWQTYMQAKGWFSVVPSVFSISHWVYFAFLVLFSLALAVSIFIKIHKHHPHVILQTLGLIGLLAVMWKF
ncbi:MAG: CAP domain-containing protein [Patescibacteria group bacterium]